MLSKHFYLRALVISTAKSVLLAMLSLLVIQFIAGNIPIKVHALSMGIILVLVTFLFGEWIFAAERIPPRGVGVAVVLTYAWEVLLNILIWSFILEQNLFFTQSITHHLIYFTLHAMAMTAALYDVRRLGPRGRGPVEGLTT